MDVRAYLDRIGYDGPLAPTADTLRVLHRRHMLSVPFENLDIGRGREIVLDPERFVEKVVRQHRGGFCYELNGAFASLLESLGFRVTLLSARVANDQEVLSAEFDHLALRVDLEEAWLADVGFGDNFIEPLHLASYLEQQDPAGSFRVIDAGARWRLEQRQMDGTWRLQYAFSLLPRLLSEFRHVPLSSDLAGFPFHAQSNLLAGHVRRPHHTVRHAPGRYFERQEGRADARNRGGLARGASRALWRDSQSGRLAKP